MKPAPNLPNSLMLKPILSRITKTTSTASLYSYGSLLLNLIKSNEKNYDLDERIKHLTNIPESKEKSITKITTTTTVTSNKPDSPQKKQSVKDSQTSKSNETSSKRSTIVLLTDSLAYLNSLSDSVKSISNQATQIYEKYSLTTASKKPTSESTKQTKDLSLKTTASAKVALATKSETSQTKRPLMQAELFAVRKAAEEKLAKLSDSIEKATDSSNLVKYVLVNELFQTLYDTYDNNDTRLVVSKEQKQLIRNLLNLKQIINLKQEKKLAGTINECLALLGYVDQTSLRYNGINVLSLDGGGAKGLVTIEILKQIQKLCGGKPIYEIFDYICGTSTGAILASLLGIYKLSLEECEHYYKDFSKDMFDRTMAAGLSNLLKAYSYYDTQHWESMLNLAMGDTLVINSAKDENACKISIVSNVTTPNQIKIFLFRNYHLPSFSHSHYDGTCKYKVWQAVRASSAAPGYYEDFKLDGYVFHDGGILANNPTAIAIHEAKLLWPKSNINCVVSVGNGRYKPDGYASSKVASINLKQKISRIVSGVSSTENVHTMMCDLLPGKIYYRFNPYMSEEFSLDETRQEKWEIMKTNTKLYMRRNDYKFKMLQKQLLKPKSKFQKAQNYLYKNYNCSF